MNNYWVDHFVRSSLFAKGIYIMLAGLSVWAWAIIFRKMFLFRRIGREQQQFLGLYRKNRRDPFSLFRHIQSARQSYTSPLASIFIRACGEVDSLQRENGRGGPNQADGTPTLDASQLESLEELLTADLEVFTTSLDSGQTFLATASSISPLLGLLGTVWGILEIFRNLGLEGSASMTGMAPGLAEALITTVAGLMVAIPANLAFNFLGTRSRILALETNNFITEFITNLERYGRSK
jgi:biopolymer transport protein ExbB/TolQ